MALISIYYMVLACCATWLGSPSWQSLPVPHKADICCWTKQQQPTNNTTKQKCVKGSFTFVWFLIWFKDEIVAMFLIHPQWHALQRLVRILQEIFWWTHAGEQKEIMTNFMKGIHFHLETSSVILRSSVVFSYFDEARWWKCTLVEYVMKE